MKKTLILTETELINILKNTINDLKENDLIYLEENKIDKTLYCVPKEFRIVIKNLLKKGYDKFFLKVALSVIGRESSYGSGLRYNITSPLKTISSYLGIDTSIGVAQMKKSTAEGLKIKESLLTIEGALIGVYKYIKRSYQIAQQQGYSTNKPSSNFKYGTGNAALDISIASYNMGVEIITKYCNTNEPKIKRPCSMYGKLVEQSVIGAPNFGVIDPKSYKKRYKVTNNFVPNYLPNFRTIRWDNVNITIHGYVKEVAQRMKGFSCF